MRLLPTLAALATAVGCNSTLDHEVNSVARTDDVALVRVTGIGGIFFKSTDPNATREWYGRHLGIGSGDFGGSAFLWRERDRPEEVGYTIWTPFVDSADYFAPSEASFMVNFRVGDLERLLATLRAEGVEIVGGIDAHPNGKFAWILDPEGRKIELWEPVPSAEDPYLP